VKTAVADLILKYVEAEGVEYVFGIPGTTLVPLLAAFNRNPRVKPILAKHEEGAAFMADGYARVKGSLGVCFATSGPGATNLVSGVATAVNYDIPVAWIVQNNAKLGLVHELQKFSLGENTVATTFKEVNLAKVAEGLGAVGHRISKPNELKELLPKAIASGKPTVIDCLVDPDEVPPLAPFVQGMRNYTLSLDMI